MAYFLPFYDDDEMKQAQSQGSQLVPMGSTSGALGGSVPTSDQQTPQAQAASSAGYTGPMGPSGGFTNFDRWLNANKTTAEREAKKAQADIGKKAQGAAEGIAGAEGDFNRAVTAGSPFAPQMPNTKQQATQNPYAPATMQPAGSVGNKVGLQPHEQQRVAAGENPAANTVSSPGQKRQELQGVAQKGAGAQGSGVITPDEAARLGAQKYSGPTDFQTWLGSKYGDLTDRAKSAQDLLDATKDNYGLEAYLQGRPGEDPMLNGGTALDAALMGAVGSKGFEDLRNKYGDMGKRLAGATGRANNFAKEQSDYSTNMADDYAKLGAAGQASAQTMADAATAGAADQKAAAALHQQRAQQPYKNLDSYISSFGMDEGLYNSLSDDDWSELMRLMRARDAYGDEVEHSGGTVTGTTGADLESFIGAMKAKYDRAPGYLTNMMQFIQSGGG